MGKDKWRRHGLLCLTSVWLTAVFTTAAVASPTSPPAGKPTPSRLMQVAMPFVANAGQLSDPAVRYYTQTFGGNFYVRENGEMLYLFTTQPRGDVDKKGLKPRQSPGDVKTALLRESLVNSRMISLEAKEPTATRVNSFVGNDRSRWKTNMPTYRTVSLGEVYTGISLSLRAYAKRVEKLFTVHPGADAGAVRLKMDGARKLKVNEQGELEITTDLGEVRFSRPMAYQERDGALEEVRVAYVVDGMTYGFKAEDYDASRPLVIDPYLSYGTYLGGTGDEWDVRLALDGSGNAYMAGTTDSADFLSNFNGGSDIFVAKLAPSGAALVYATYLGGEYFEQLPAIAVDASGNAYVTGATSSSDFPTLHAITGLGSYQGPPFTFSPGGGDVSINTVTGDGFVAKLDASGNLIYSTYLGGADDDQGTGIAVDGAGSAYVTGLTTSDNTATEHFPLVNAYQSTLKGHADAFLAKLIWDGANLSLAYSTYLGGTSSDSGWGIAVDGSGDAYVTGGTESTDFPAANTCPGTVDAFVTKFAWTGSSLNLAYSTCLGGTNYDEALGVALDGAGNAYVTGETLSTDFPLQSAFQSHFGGATEMGGDAFVTKLDSSGAVIYSTYLGGIGRDRGESIAVDATGNAFVTGYTSSGDFPTLNAYQEQFAGATEMTGDAFVTEFNASGALLYSSYLGGIEFDGGSGVAVDGSGNVYVSGTTLSADFPTRLDSFQPHFSGPAGKADAFVVKFSPGEPDFTPPTLTVLTSEYTLTKPVPYPVNFQVRIEDPSGVYYNPADPQWSIILRQKNLLLSNFTFTASSDLTSGTLSYADSGTHFLPGQCYSVTVEARDILKNIGSLTLYFTVEDPSHPDPEAGFYPCPNPIISSPAVCLKDSDYDGIPDDGVTLSTGKVLPYSDPSSRPYGSEKEPIQPGEPVLTNKAFRTLYVRPLIVPEGFDVPIVWYEFAQLLPELNKPFNQIGVELVPIMDALYDPYTDPMAPSTYKPPVSIVQVTYDLKASPQDTYFNSFSKQWYWGLLGYTPYEIAVNSNKDKYGFFRSTINGNSIKAYIHQRQYTELVIGAPKQTPTYNPAYTSPMNFGNDGTVEFNPFVFDSSGTILAPLPQLGTARAYAETQILMRVIAHEIGHALLNASEGDHCQNPDCIMFGSLSSVAGWGISGVDTSGNPIGFGPGKGACVHSATKVYDLRPRVFNTLNPTYLP